MFFCIKNYLVNIVYIINLINFVSLSRLAERTGIDQEMSEAQKEFIDILEPLNIEARYPSYKERLMRSLNNEFCIDLIQKTEDLRIWIKNRL